MRNTTCTWRTLGCAALLALALPGLVLADSTANFAPTGPGDTKLTATNDATATGKRYFVAEGSAVDIPVEVMYDPEGSNHAITIAVTGDEANSWTFYGPGVTHNAGMITFMATERVRRVVITGASIVDPNGANEMARLTIAEADRPGSTGNPGIATNAQPRVTATVVDPQRPRIAFKKAADTFLEGQTGEVELTAVLSPEFVHNPAAKVTVEEVGGGRKVQLLRGTTSGAVYGFDKDGRLEVTFTSSMTSAKFKVQVQEDADGANDEVTLMLASPAAGRGAQLGTTMTTIELMLIDDDEGDGTPTPTPTLPLAGMFLLGAGLVAGARKRFAGRKLLTR